MSMLQTVSFGATRFGITLALEGWLKMKIGLKAIEATMVDRNPRAWPVLGEVCKVVYNRTLDTLDIRGVNGRFPVLIRKSDWETVKAAIQTEAVGKLPPTP